MSKFSQTTFRSGFLSQDTTRFNVQIGSSKNVDNRLDQGRQMSTTRTTSFGMRSLGQPLRNHAAHSSMLQEGNVRLNQDQNPKNNTTSIISRSFCPAVRNTTLTTGLQMEDVVRYNEEVMDEGVFHRPAMLSIIRGRNSTMSSRLFHNQNAQKQFREFNNRNMSHISHRGVDILSESRLALNMRNNWMDNQSLSGSVINSVSLKAQFMNLLDNLHHSILSMGPYATAECLRLEFEKAKQGLDNISEMSFAPSIRQGNAPSIINQSTKYTCPPICESTVECNEGLNLKSSKEIVKSFMAPSICSKSKIISLRREREMDSEVNSSLRESNDEEESSVVFKKPKAPPKKRKSSTGARIKVLTSTKAQSKSGNKSINLKQWYPVADGSNLQFCGVDEKGTTVKTEPVKKRLTCRKVELVSGTNCNLIGSPSTVVSVLPVSVAKLLKNGLTDRWRVFQRELLNCQIAKEERQIRVSRSPKKNKTPPKKKTVKKALKGAAVTKKESGGDSKVSGTQTRSGRCVKPPTMFWLSSSSANNEATSASESLKMVESPERKARTNKRTRNDGNYKKPINKSPKKPSPGKETKKKTQKEESPKKGKRKGSKDEVAKVESSTKEGNRRHNTSRSPSKRKREDATEADHVQKKKSKIVSEPETEEAESFPEPVTTSVENVETGSRSRARQGKKPTAKKREIKKKKIVENVSKTRLSEFEGNFDFKLDDIELPEIANVSGNRLLSRSQLRLVNMETPPLKYFNTNLQLLRSTTTTPMRSPDWCISQRTELEVKQFQRRREEAFRKRVKTNVEKKTVTREITRNVKNRDVERVMQWVAEKTVRSPQSNSKVVQYVIPSRKLMEAEAEEEEDEEEEENFEFS